MKCLKEKPLDKITVSELAALHIEMLEESAADEILLWLAIAFLSFNLQAF